MFFLPQGGTVEGLDDERPIKLDGITKDEFEQLLRVLLHRLATWFSAFNIQHLAFTHTLQKSRCITSVSN